ncbi:AAA family ATPase [Brochothrix thermosphacta]|uniref:AAA family ATPase n=1 Tax=Brochothrix thermosphacta TaxID=2756 RepID=UPI00265D5647|nr:AAA family ATPase [Brochothrix thermosphacta]WKK69242.1 AAA family ATPase [Brochothrix thermosphacta]
MDLIKKYNEKIRANDTTAIREDGLIGDEYIENVVIYANDFSSVTDHVISNFPNIVLLGHDIQNVYIQNAPKRVEYSLRGMFDNIIKDEEMNYFKSSEDNVLELYNSLSEGKIIGQLEAKKKTCIGLYKSTILKVGKPLVMLYYGPSGVGKTELAKQVSDCYGGTLTRIQFSMMQTEESYKYIFGDSHGKASFARDLLGRDSNIVLIDEFDKVSSELYNVFYQMFDEGEFEDINYKVDVSGCVFILTSNFNNEKHMAEKLGLPIYSRIDAKIKFKQLSTIEIKRVIENTFTNIYQKLSDDDVAVIEKIKLKDKYFNSVETFKNIRLLDKFIENNVFEILFEEKLKSK